MASAKKCDRCGEFFDHRKKEIKYIGFTNPVFLNNEVSRVEESHPCDCMFADRYPSSGVDLCPACSERFSKFMFNAEPKNIVEDIEPTDEDNGKVTMDLDELIKFVNSIVYKALQNGQNVSDDSYVDDLCALGGRIGAHAKSIGIIQGFGAVIGLEAD